jgi:hypothetical protein
MPSADESVERPARSLWMAPHTPGAEASTAQTQIIATNMPSDAISVAPIISLRARTMTELLFVVGSILICFCFVPFNDEAT